MESQCHAKAPQGSSESCVLYVVGLSAQAEADRRRPLKRARVTKNHAKVTPLTLRSCLTLCNVRLSGESHSHLAGKCLIRPLGEKNTPQPIRALFPRPLIKPTLCMTLPRDHY